MIKTSNGNYIYLVVPAKYECIYINLINKVSNIGLDLIKDCNCSCQDSTKIIIECWNMFQAAIIAYDENRENDADVIMININNKLELGCDTSCYGDKYIYSGSINNIPDTDIILKGDKVVYNKEEFTSSFYKKINYIALPKGKVLDTVENVNFKGDYLYNIKAGINLYNYNKTISINKEEYLLYICELDKPLNSNVIIKTKDGNWNDLDTIYYGNSIDIPTESDIDSSNEFNPNIDNELIFKFDTLVHFIIIPNNRKVDYIRSINGTIDWLYNKELDIDLYNKQQVVIGDQSYTLYYYKSIEPINGDIKLVLK